MKSERELRRVTLLIAEEQYERISKEGLNLSWLIRDLIDDHFSKRKISLDVSEETLKLYHSIVGMAATPDSEFEPFLKDALGAYLKAKISQLQKLEKSKFKGSSST
jgi:hypothetical protein